MVDISEFMWIDPPEGWRYGFPKLYNKKTDPSVTEWLLKEGYPKEEEPSYYRMWAPTEEELLKAGLLHNEKDTNNHGS